MIKNYLTFDVAKDMTDPAEKLLARNNCLNNAVLSLERNSNDIQKLTSECFYSEQFWNNVKPLLLFLLVVLCFCSRSH